MKNLFFEKHFKTEVSDSIQRFEVIMSSFSSSEDIINEVLKFKVKWLELPPVSDS